MRVVAIGLLVSSLVAAVGAARDRWHLVELSGAFGAGMLLSAYLVSAVAVAVRDGSLDVNRAVFSVMVLIISAMPTARGISLLPRLIRRLAVRLAQK